MPAPRIKKLIDEILNPSDEYTPIPFWFLNDRLEEAELKRQLVDFAAKGVSGVVLHPRIGIPSTLPYLSEAYFSIMRFIAETAESLSMRLVLYDEGMYPSGSAHGEVVRANPAFASIGLKRADAVGRGKCIASLPDGRYLVQDYSGGTIRGIHFGEDDGEPNAPPSADILNPEAVSLFIQLTHDRYYEHLKPYFGATIIGFFTDEPCVLGRNTRGFIGWTDGLEEKIVSAGGCLADLAALFDDKENETTALYRAIIKKELNDVYYKRLAAWCEAHGVALMGHPERSDDIEEQRYFHVPGQDLIMRRVSPERGGLCGMDSVQAKCSADAARHLGRRRNSNECFGVCNRAGHPWHLTGGDMKWFIDWLGVRGVNLFIPHAFYYSIRGKRKDERPPDVGPNNIWWPHYRMFSDYIKRLSYIMTDSVSCAKVAVLCESGSMPFEEAAPLYEHQIDFDYVPASWVNGPDAFVSPEPYAYCMGGGLPGENAKRITDYQEIVERDFVTDHPCKDLRVTHRIKDGVHLYLLVNEGDNPIAARATVSAQGMPLYLDLWHGLCYTQEGPLSFSLDRRQSLLIVLDPDGTMDALPRPVRHPIEGLRFLPEWEADNQKGYRAVYTALSPSGMECFSIHGEEMVSCHVNGVFAGVSFWNPHTFRIGEHLHAGDNDIWLTFTGSAANTVKPGSIPFGMEP